MKYKLKILVVLLITFTLFSFLYYRQAVKPVNPLNRDSVAFSIDSGEDVRTIAQRLEDEDLIRSALIFFIKARVTDLGKNIQAGDFILSQAMNMDEISSELLHGTSDIQITFPEGWRKEEIATKITTEFDIPESEILKNAREGYLFPDTYHLPREATASQIIRLMENNFAEKTANLEKSSLAKHSLTFDDAIIIASMVEREAKLPEDRPIIASVMLNRLSIGMKLDIDATVQYALGYEPSEKRWWKQHLTLEDLAIDSPYNTYINPGLPPEPIANPGLAAIQSVLKAPNTDYLYYIADSTGKSHFAKDIEGHNANISRYLSK